MTLGVDVTQDALASHTLQIQKPIKQIKTGLNIECDPSREAIAARHAELTFFVYAGSFGDRQL